MHRIRSDMSVQTDARVNTEQCTQVGIDQSTEWTQCIISQTDQSVQAIYEQSPATVQAAPETSDAAIQTLPAERLSSTVNKNKLNTDSKATDHCEAEDGSSNTESSKEVANASAVKPLVEIVDRSPSLTECLSGEELHPQEQQNTPATSANFFSEMSGGRLAAQTPVTSAASHTAVDQFPNECVAGEVAAVVQNQFLPTTVSVLQPAFSMSTARKYTYSFKEETFLTSSLMLEKSSEVRSHVASMPTQRLIHETPLLAVTQALVKQGAAQTCVSASLSAEPIFEACTTNPDERKSKIGSSHADATVVTGEARGGTQLPTTLQQNVFTLCIDNSSAMSETTAQQEITAKKFTSSVLVQSAPASCDIRQNTSLPVTKVTNSASMNHSSYVAAQLEELVAVESNQQRVHFSAGSTTSQLADTQGGQFSADAIVLERDSGKFGTQNRKVVEESQNVAVHVSTCEQSSSGESPSMSRAKNSVSSVSSADVTTVSRAAAVMASASRSAFMGTRAESGYCINKGQKAVVQTAMNSNEAGSGDCTVNRGRSRRSLYICRGPLMETEATECKSPQGNLRRESVSNPGRKLPVMLMGTFSLLVPSYF